MSKGTLKLASALVGLLITAFITITYAALEWNEVAIATTEVSGTTEQRLTHIWYIQTNDKLLLEAGNPKNPWVQDLKQGSTLVLNVDGNDSSYGYKWHGPESHKNIRERMRSKYGWRDWWISVIFDTSQSFAIEIYRNDD